MKKKIFKIISILLILVLAVVVLLSLPWLLIYAGLLFEPNPPKPEIVHGEFC